jgi:hypothetical protein
MISCWPHGSSFQNSCTMAGVLTLTRGWDDKSALIGPKPHSIGPSGECLQPPQVLLSRNMFRQWGRIGFIRKGEVESKAAYTVPTSGRPANPKSNNRPGVVAPGNRPAQCSQPPPHPANPGPVNHIRTVQPPLRHPQDDVMHTPAHTSEPPSAQPHPHCPTTSPPP